MALFFGDEGDNTFHFTGEGDFFFGEAGNDTMVYSSAPSVLFVDLLAGNGRCFGFLSDDFDSIENVIGGAFNDVLVGSNVANRLEGGAGNDQLQGEAGDDRLDGGSGDDVLSGQDGDDILAGGAGNDKLFGGAGEDTIVGVSGPYFVNLAAQTAVGDGIDTIESIEHAMGGDFDDTLLGDLLGNRLAGGGGDDTIEGNSGNDTLSGQEGDDAIEGGSGADLVDGGDGDDAIEGGSGDDALNGGDGQDALQGGSGNDSLTGGTERDVLDGGGGIDTASYAASGRVVVNLSTGKASGDGTDTLSAIENVTGSAFNDRLTGDELANALTGGAGDDVLSGGAGDDTLDGGAGDDRLDGGAGADVAAGGSGNDIYFVDNAGDVVTESAGQGTDTVRTTLSSYTLGAEVERLLFIGSGDFAGTGNALANILSGGAGSDTLNGGGADDTLNGGAGADAMVGGEGNDTYYVDDAGDVVTEAAGQGIDAVRTTLSSYMLGTEVERLLFTGSGDFVGTGNALANGLVGGAGNDTLDGGAGDDRLDGRAGADVAAGGSGNDVYYVDNADQVIEVAGGGSDKVCASADFTLGAGQEVEFLQVYGSSGLTLTGNELANSLIGGAGNDTLNGGAGNDRLDGRGGSDAFLFNTSLVPGVVTQIVGFAPGADHFSLAGSVFTAAGSPGTLAATAFFIGSAAHDEDDRIIYDSTNGQVMYDADGTGSSAGVTFATVSPGLSISANDFWLV